MNNKLRPVGRMCASIGAIPTSYLVSLSYEEQLIYLCKKMDEVINFINDNIESQIREYIDIRFNEIMLESMYDSTTETLVLYLNNEGE